MRRCRGSNLLGEKFECALRTRFAVAASYPARRLLSNPCGAFSLFFYGFRIMLEAFLGPRAPAPRRREQPIPCSPGRASSS